MAGKSIISSLLYLLVPKQMSCEKAPLRLAFFGAAPDTSNMGVSALFFSAVQNFAERLAPLEFVVFDNGLCRRESSVKLSSGGEVPVIYFGARAGKKYHREENLSTMTVASRFLRLGPLVNQAIQLIDTCDAVLDVSGGDSFSDIYGRKRFDTVYLPKLISLRRSKPLILLPQTYGPYRSPGVHALAASAVKRVTMAWARDPKSFDVLKELLGDKFDPRLHRSGVDMAFALAPTSAEHLLPSSLKAWLRKPLEELPLVGFNISGLIYNDQAAATKRYGLKVDYRDVVIRFLAKLLEETQARVVLIPHVMSALGHYESDLTACEDAASHLQERHRGRVIVSPNKLDQSQVKWLIAQLDWFCGTRMHSTIAALSSGVPAASIAYSDKTADVFSTLAQEGSVADPRMFNADQVLSRLMGSFQRRASIKRELNARLVDLRLKLASDFDAIAEQIRRRSGVF